MATPNNFKVTDAIGSTDNFAGADVKFFHITLIQSDSSVLDIRNELDFNETVHNLMKIENLTDNKTEQALLNIPTYLLMVSENTVNKNSINTRVLEDAHLMDDLVLEKYLPDLTSFCEVNPGIDTNT